MPRVIVIVQRDMFGEIAGYLVALEDDVRRWPLREEETLEAAMAEGWKAVVEYGALKIEVDRGETK